ncbi:MAG: HAMP domain-containing histidine kinase [Clostridiales bacterium]|nr:HAMP domain-containing histidine kinase [Candidatus Cacconaster stercorequi]
MGQYDENQIKLLTEVLPQVAAQLRASMGNIQSALHSIVTAEQRDQDPKLDQSTAILSQSYYRMLRLVNNLTLAPMLVEDTPFLLQRVELVEWLRDLCRQAEPLAEEAGIHLTFQTELRGHMTGIHPEYMERLVWNLLSNALKFTPSGGEITVSLRLAGGQILLAVADTGCGIPEARQERLFDGYLHTDRMDAAPHGLGLGLPLCRRIAQGHGGRLLLQSRVGEGTTVTVSLPAQTTAVHGLHDVPFHYAGGFQPVMVELSDALPYRAFLQKHLD